MIWCDIKGKQYRMWILLKERWRKHACASSIPKWTEFKFTVIKVQVSLWSSFTSRGTWLQKGGTFTQVFLVMSRETLWKEIKGTLRGGGRGQTLDRPGGRIIFLLLVGKQKEGGEIGCNEASVTGSGIHIYTNCGSGKTFLALALYLRTTSWAK